MAYFNRPGTSNNPIETSKGRLEYLHGSALGFPTEVTASPDPCSRPAGSDHDYALYCEKPVHSHPAITPGYCLLRMLSPQVRRAP